MFNRSLYKQHFTELNGKKSESCKPARFKYNHKFIGNTTYEVNFFFALNRIIISSFLTNSNFLFKKIEYVQRLENENATRLQNRSQNHIFRFETLKLVKYL